MALPNVGQRIFSATVKHSISLSLWNTANWFRVLQVSYRWRFHALQGQSSLVVDGQTTGFHLAFKNFFIFNRLSVQPTSKTKDFFCFKTDKQTISNDKSWGKRPQRLFELNPTWPFKADFERHSLFAQIAAAQAVGFIKNSNKVHKGMPPHNESSWAACFQA